ncbi:MAG TPA: hypothetical protein VMZ92_07025 [Planctomycetota bacterium]|nr:hypothetical protein [Planctomycetota bacterium]
MDYREQFLKIILEKGMVAAKAERDRIVRAVDEGLSAACRGAAETAGIATAEGGRTAEASRRRPSVREMVILALEDQGGEMRSPDLYDLAETEGRQRTTVYVAVSKLIKEGRIRKGALPDTGRGSLLTLVHPVRRECPREEVDALIAEVLAYLPMDPFLSGFGEKLRKDLDSSDYAWLTLKGYERLAHWCHPEPDREREQYVQPRARKMSLLLFGRVIERV